MISILLVDDEPLSNQRMRGLLTDHPQIEIAGEAGSVAEARACLRAHTPDAVFLDVEMQGGDSFGLLPELGQSTQVVFVTAHERHAVDAFAVGAVDYLVKPVDPERLIETLRRLLKHRRDAAEPMSPVAPPTERPLELVELETEGEARLAVPLRKSGQKTVVTIADICWIESLRNYTRVALRNPPRLLVFRRRLGEWLTDLPREAFARLSRSEVVQLSLVSSTEWKSRGETIVTFTDGVAPLTLGRMPAIRLGKLLGDGSAD